MLRAIRSALILALVAPVVPATAAGAAPDRIRFKAPAGESLLVHGEYPKRSSSCVNPYQPLLHARFRGTVEVGRAANGSLFVIGELAFEDYLKGIAEVPRSWPMESLKAQVVAARSYAMARMRMGSSQGRALGYDLCATEACQVYLGMGIEAGPWGGRWVRAVEETADEILVHDGKPAETLYSSTSPGRTFDSETVFGGAAKPYLRGGPERDDAESPLSRWEVRIPFDDLDRFLRASGRWDGGGVRGVRDTGNRIVIRGRERLRITREDLRSALNAVASCLDPGYPQTKPDGYRLPQTVPSKWYEARQEGAELVLEGRGWGHGVGMVQWGAKGKADRGMSYGDILAAYYGGLRPQRTQGPGTIRVLIAEGLRRVTLVPSASAEVTGAPRDREPPWRVLGGERLRLRTGPAPDPVLEVAPRAPQIDGEDLVVHTELEKAASLRMELVADGAIVATTAWRPFRDGVARLTEPLGVLRGTYEVRVTADDGVDRVRAAAGTIDLGGPSPAVMPATPAPPVVEAEDVGRRVPFTAIAGVGAGVLLLLILLLTLRRRRRLHRA